MTIWENIKLVNGYTPAKTVSTFLFISMLFPAAYAQQVKTPSPSECAAQAQAASSSRNSTMGDVARGAGAGLLLGGIVGDSSDAAGGALIGALVGGVRSSNQQNADYERAYRRCMYGLQYMR